MHQPGGMRQAGLLLTHPLPLTGLRRQALQLLRLPANTFQFNCPRRSLCLSQLALIDQLAPGAPSLSGLSAQFGQLTARIQHLALRGGA